MHDASNLVPGDRDLGSFDIFVHDRRSATTELVSDRNDGLNDDATSVAISGSGRFVAFAAPTALVPGDTNGALDVYVRDRRTGAATRVSVGPDEAASSTARAPSRA